MYSTFNKFTGRKIIYNNYELQIITFAFLKKRMPKGGNVKFKEYALPCIGISSA